MCNLKNNTGQKKFKSQIHNDKYKINTPMKFKICKARHMHRKYKNMEKREIGCRKGTQVG